MADRPLPAGWKLEDRTVTWGKKKAGTEEESTEEGKAGPESLKVYRVSQEGSWSPTSLTVSLGNPPGSRQPSPIQNQLRLPSKASKAL